MKLLKTMVEKTLSYPLVFELQQKFCNNYDAVFNEFSDYLNKAGLCILDIGCSTGTCGSSIIDMKNNQYHGIDLNENYVKIAANNFPLGNFQSMNAKDMQFEDKKFDVVLLIGTLHHMSNEVITTCLKDVLRVLKPHGVVLIGEPVFTKNWWLSSFLLSLDRGEYIRTQENYKKLFTGFKIKRESYFKFSAHRFCSFVLQK